MFLTGMRGAGDGNNIAGVMDIIGELSGVRAITLFTGLNGIFGINTAEMLLTPY